MSDPVSATLRVRLKPWAAPNFARRADIEDQSSEGAIPVNDLDDDALEDMALAWIEDLYRKAGQRRCPFYKTAKVGGSNA